jgi:hypothetical protein
MQAPDSSAGHALLTSFGRMYVINLPARADRRRGFSRHQSASRTDVHDLKLYDRPPGLRTLADLTRWLKHRYRTPTPAA